jgi:uncharacterized protein (DUF169 family)
VDLRTIEQRISSGARLTRRPVAVTFLDAPPSGVEKFSGTEPSGCSFWRLAEAGRSFFTVPSDHFNCALGSYTLNIELSPDRVNETSETLGLMFRVGYIRPQDVSQIPRLKAQPAFVLYSSLGDSPVMPSVVLFACTPMSAMLLQEAAGRAGKAAAVPVLGRPTCMALPAALAYGTVASLGCVGNRTYTGLTDGELYVAVRGEDLAEVADALEVIASANAELASYAQGRRDALATE